MPLKETQLHFIAAPLVCLVFTLGAFPRPVLAETTKSETLGLTLAVAATAIPAGLFALEVRRNSDNIAPLAAAGILTLVGPSTGRWYVGRSGWQGMTIRYSGLMLLAIGVSDLDEARRCQDALEPQCDDAPNEKVSWTLTGLGATAIAASTIYDIVTTPREIRSWRERHKLRVVPVAQSRFAGLAISGIYKRKA